MYIDNCFPVVSNYAYTQPLGTTLMKHSTKLYLRLISILIVISFVVLIIIYSFKDQEEYQKINNEYFQNFNESFSGRIIEISEHWSTHSCMLFVQLDTSTTSNYDIRSETKYYYCVINGNRAEIIEDIKYGDEGEPKNWIRKGDRIKFDGQKDTAFLYHNDSLVLKWKPIISTFMLNNIRSLHRIK